MSAPALFAEIDTPALLLDRGRIERNCARMSARADAFGVRLRPHMKTAKCAEAAALATRGHDPRIAVSTLREAGWFLARGYRDLLYAVGIVPARLDRVAALLAAGARLGVVTDDLAVARVLADWSATAPARLRVLIEVDTGGARAGVAPDSAEVVELGRIIDAAAGLDPGGVMTHAGHAYHATSVTEVAAIAAAERDGAAAAAERLRASGLGCPEVSVGSTPTAVHAADLSGVTEMRPGVYMFNDLSQLALGSCTREDLALSVLATVIGHHRTHRQLLIDAGGLALSKDAGLAAHRPEVGYGEVCDVATLAPLPGLYVADTHQEHGIVPLPDDAWFERLPVGAQVRVLPGHACMTAAAHDRYRVLDDGRVVDCWPRFGGW